MCSYCAFENSAFYNSPSKNSQSNILPYFVNPPDLRGKIRTDNLRGVMSDHVLMR